MLGGYNGLHVVVAGKPHNFSSYFNNSVDNKYPKKYNTHITIRIEGVIKIDH